MVKWPITTGLPSYGRCCTAGDFLRKKNPNWYNLLISHIICNSKSPWWPHWTWSWGQMLRTGSHWWHKPTSCTSQLHSCPNLPAFVHQFPLPWKLFPAAFLIAGSTSPSSSQPNIPSSKEPSLTDHPSQILSPAPSCFPSQHFPQ